MAIKLATELIALCDYATISRENKLSINGIFDEIRVTQLPGGIARAFLVATIHGAAEKNYKISIKLENDSDGKNLLNPLHIDLQTSPNGKHNLLVELVNVRFEREGEYHFRIYYGDDEIGSTLLKVIHVAQDAKRSFQIVN